LNIDQLGSWAAFIALALTSANILFTWLHNPVRVAKARHDALKKKVGDDLKDHDRRIQKLEDTDEHMPTKEDLHALALEMKALTTKLSGLEATVSRMDRHLLERGK